MRFFVTYWIFAVITSGLVAELAYPDDWGDWKLLAFAIQAGAFAAWQIVEEVKRPRP